QPLLTPRRVFPWHQSQPGSKLAALAKGSSVSDSRDECCGGQRTNARNPSQTLASLSLPGDPLNQGVCFFQPAIQLFQFRFQLCQKRAYCSGQRDLSILQNRGQHGFQMTSSCPYSNAALQQQATNLIDHSRAALHPELAHPMQGLQI